MIHVLACLCGVAHEPETGLRHWEKASPDPDRIFLTFNGDPATTRAVTWRTDTSVTAAVAEVAVATGSPKFSEGARRISARTETLDLNVASLNRQGEVHYHSVLLNELRPDTLYAYRVGDGEEHWSEWIQFRTAAPGNTPFRFVYFGDAQNNILSHWSRNIRMAYQTAPDAAFAIHAGDLVNEGHSDLLWAEWHKAGGWIHSQWTGIPVLGNHELRPLSRDQGNVVALQWRPQFTLPVVENLPEALKETVYAVDYQGVRIIVLDSMRETEAQEAFLEQELKRPGAMWTVVTSHYSIFSGRKGRNFEAGRLGWKAIMDRYGVDLVLQGHDHLYARGQVPVRSTDGTYGDSFQTMYVTSVSGPKVYEISEEQLNSYSKDGYRVDSMGAGQQFFQVIHVDGNTLGYKAYTADGVLYDSAVITKDPVTGAKTCK
jgi:3',5'-cyclic AMP phosphodiesterase CpdA